MFRGSSYHIQESKGEQRDDSKTILRYLSLKGYILFFHYVHVHIHEILSLEIKRIEQRLVYCKRNRYHSPFPCLFWATILLDFEHYLAKQPRSRQKEELYQNGSEN